MLIKFSIDRNYPECTDASMSGRVCGVVLADTATSSIARFEPVVSVLCEVAFSGACGSSVTARILRVSINGTDSAACGSAQLPCRTMQHAINLASAADTILLASSALPCEGGEQGVSIAKSLFVASATRTELDCASARRAFTVNDVSVAFRGIVVRNGNARTAGAMLIEYTSVSSNISVSITDCSFIGNVAVPGDLQSAGAVAILFHGEAGNNGNTITITNTSFVSNELTTELADAHSAGALVIVVTSAFEIANVVNYNYIAMSGVQFDHNTASCGANYFQNHCAGALALVLSVPIPVAADCQNDNSVVMVACTFTNNVVHFLSFANVLAVDGAGGAFIILAEHGGVRSGNNNTVTVSRCSFARNSVVDHRSVIAAGVSASVGALLVELGFATTFAMETSLTFNMLTIDATLFDRNVAEMALGAAAALSIAFRNILCSVLSISHCTFSGNRAADSPAFELVELNSAIGWLTANSLTVTGCSFSSNVVQASKTPISSALVADGFSGNVLVYSSVFTANSGASAVAILNTFEADAVPRPVSSNITFLDCLFQRNRHNQGAGFSAASIVVLELGGKQLLVAQTHFVNEIADDGHAVMFLREAFTDQVSRLDRHVFVDCSWVKCSGAVQLEMIAVGLESQPIVFSRCAFINNTARGNIANNRAALWAFLVSINGARSPLSIETCSFVTNSGFESAALITASVYNGTAFQALHMRNTQFIKNDGRSSGPLSFQASRQLDTGALDCSIEFFIAGTLFKDNSASNSMYESFGFGGALTAVCARLQLFNTTMIGNRATEGGALHLVSIDLNATRVRFADNRADSIGHMISSIGGTMRFRRMNLTMKLDDAALVIAGTRMRFSQSLMVCPAGSTPSAVDAAVFCASCPALTYLLDGGVWDGAGQHTKCMPCPYAARCAGGTGVFVLQGNWATIIHGVLHVSACGNGRCCSSAGGCVLSSVCQYAL